MTIQVVKAMMRVIKKIVMKNQARRTLHLLQLHAVMMSYVQQKRNWMNI